MSVVAEWPLVAPNDDGIRPAGRPDECFYCRRRVGEEHKRDCVMVTKLVEYAVVATVGDQRFEARWVKDVPYGWDADMCNFHKNEGSWCADNFLDERDKGTVEWVGPSGWEAMEAAVAETEKKFGPNCCTLCPKLRFTFVRVVDHTPRRELR